MSEAVLITGCSSGFGKITAQFLAQKGYKVYASMRNLKNNPFKNKYKYPNITVLQLDVTNKKSISTAIKKIPSLDVIINNAGYIQAGMFEDLSEKEVRDQMETNFFGVFNVTKATYHLLKKSKRAKIINISSVSGRFSAPGLGAYAASKFAVEAMSESMRIELKKEKIDVFLIEPGAYNTSLFKKNIHLSTSKRNDFFKRIISGVQKNSRKNIYEIPILIEKIIRRGGKLRWIVGAGKYYKIRKMFPLSWIENIIYKATQGNHKK